MIKGVHSRFHPAVQGTAAGSAEPRRGSQRISGENNFEALLKQKMGEKKVHFSRHAIERMAHRNIHVGPEEMEKINGAVDRAAEKGARDSLLIMDRHAFIVSVENRTVVTAMDRESVRDNLFTNIDSAILL